MNDYVDTFSPDSQFVLSLCSGGGGLDLGVKLALPSMRTVAYVEIEAFACAVLVRQMEEGRLDAAPLWTDLRTFDSATWAGAVDGIIGGYPCQPFSVAGRRQGANDPRHLWPVIREHIDIIKPAWCFFENVPGHLTLGFREVAGELQAMGYRVAATLLTAAEIGAPHKRERLFILANANSYRCERTPLQLLAGRPQQTILDAARASEDVADSYCSRQSHVQRSQTGAECLGNRATSSSSRWPTEPNVGRVADGVANRVDRLRVLGNGVVPQQAARAFSRLRAELCV